MFVITSIMHLYVEKEQLVKLVDVLFGWDISVVLLISYVNLSIVKFTGSKNKVIKDFELYK